MIDGLTDGHFTYPLDSGAQIVVRILVDRAARRAMVEITGTLTQSALNYNAPAAIT